MDTMDICRQALAQAQGALDKFVNDAEMMKQLAKAGETIAAVLADGGRVVSCGNGGSMCDAMHFAEELSGRFRGDRPPLAAAAISDPAHLSCCANDFGWDTVFSRYVEAHCGKGDVLFAISTSGTSPNVLAAAKTARERQVKVVSLTGKPDSSLGQIADIDICTPGGTRYSDRVQELHIKCIHILIEICESKLFEK